MGRKRKPGFDWLPPRVYPGRSQFELRPRDMSTIKLCAISSDRATVWRRYQEELARLAAEPDPGLFASLEPPPYVTEWSWCGPLIQKYEIELRCNAGGKWSASGNGFWHEALELQLPDADTFRSRTYQGKVYPALRCKICGNDSFRIGQEDYQTLTKCLQCGTECVAHDG